MGLYEPGESVKNEDPMTAFNYARLLQNVGSFHKKNSSKFQVNPNINIKQMGVLLPYGMAESIESSQEVIDVRRPSTSFGSRNQLAERKPSKSYESRISKLNQSFNFSKRRPKRSNVNTQNNFINICSPVSQNWPKSNYGVYQEGFKTLQGSKAIIECNSIEG